MTLIEELIEELRSRGIDSPHATLSSLRIPSGCPHLLAVAQECGPALISLCDFRDAQPLLQAREVVLEILSALGRYPAFSDDSHPTIDHVPPEAADPAYRALALGMTNEPWWRTTLREALITLLLLRPRAAGVECLAAALRSGLPVVHDLPARQRSPVIRIQLLVQYLDALDSTPGTRSTIAAMRDALTVLDATKLVRTEDIKPENGGLIQTVKSERPGLAFMPGPRERLHRLARDIGVTAVALRRAHHAPPEQVLMHAEAVHEVLRRAVRWDTDLRAVLHGCLLFGRITPRVLDSCRDGESLCIEGSLHEVWIKRRLPADHRFPPVDRDRGYEPVTRSLSLPLPRELGAALLAISKKGAGPAILGRLAQALRQAERDTGHRVSLRRLTRWFEFSLENGPPDEALLVLLGVQPNASRDAAIHYFAPSTASVVQKFQNAVVQLADRFNLEISAGGWSVPPLAEGPYVGYSYRPSVESIRALVLHLRSSSELGRGRVSAERLRTAYNSRVAMLTVMYLAATGARPSGTVLPLGTEILHVDRAVLVSEKDGLEYRSTRLVPLAERLLAELNAFTSWSIEKRLSSGQVDRARPVAMIRDAHGNLLPPTMGMLREHVSGFREHWSWPDDALRHLFRSRLWDQGCPTPWLRRVMGHYPRHAAADVPYAATPIWQGLHDWDHVIDEHLETLGL